jgi:hypothetical protein
VKAYTILDFGLGIGNWGLGRRGQGERGVRVPERESMREECTLAPSLPHSLTLPLSPSPLFKRS